jgi:membrane dipeptidase
MGAVAATLAQEDRIVERARRIHTSAIVVDTHVDAPNLRRADWRFADEHQQDHVDLPRLKKGGLDALFFSIYMAGTVTGPKAVNDALEMIAAVQKLADDLPNDVVLCTTAEEVRRANRQHKVALLMGMEGGHMINDSLPVLRTYARLGVRYLTLTHNVNTNWADAAADTPRHNGLTEFGKQVVLELNRLGVMVDISHVADKTFWDALAVSRAPMIASHSSARALAGHPRNMTDDMIKALAARGGVIQINYHIAFLDDGIAKYTVAKDAREARLEKEFPGPEHAARRDALLLQEFGPRGTTNWEKIVDHIDHAVKLIGADHVGLGSDFDGATMPAGMEDVTRLPKITEELLRRGYSQSDIRKILGENTLRLMRDVERVAGGLKKEAGKGR